MEKEYLIQKWLNDALTPEEYIAFKALDDYQFYVDIVNDAKEFRATDTLKVDDYETFNERLKTVRPKKIKSLWTNPLLRIASIIVIALGIYFAAFYNPMTQINTLAHQKTTIELPDASLVTLNALSEIEYRKRNWDERRELILNGEAYFKVQKGKTFDVVTSDGIVTVVGTEFSVKQRNDFFEVKCFEGVVRVTSNSNSKLLTAGEIYRILDGIISQRRTELLAPNWLDNISSFEIVPFKEVIAELERQYDVKVELQNFTQNPNFTGGFVHDNLHNALISITQPLNLSYKIVSPKQVVIYGQKK